MVTGGIPKDGLSKHKICPCRISAMKVKGKSVLCVQCGNRIHSCKNEEGYINVFKKNCLQAI